MKKNSKNFLAAFYLVGAVSYFTLSNANTVPPLPGGDNAGVVEAINNFRGDVVPKMEEFRKQMIDLFVKAADNLTSKSRQPNLATQNPASVPGGSNPSVYKFVEEGIQKSTMEKLQNSLAPGNVEVWRGTLLSLLPKDAKGIAAKIDAQNLLGPSVYETANPAMQNAAESTIIYLSDYASPFGRIDMEKLSANQKLSDSTQGQQYRVKTYTLAAIRSLFLSNLYESFHERMPVKGLGKLSGMSKEDASLTEVGKHIASRRISDPTWYADINNASPAVVQREMLFVLSEIQWQLHQLHVDNERMLQTMTAVGVLNLRASSAFPDQNEQALSDALNPGAGIENPMSDPDYFKKQTAGQ